ncbi:MAG: hypothetical protein DRJ47_11380 [Thermoprotei archaeon]|nr:MAG: hypothetical protein DRJ47_11380 [Thermoprotei archaeon]
MGAKQRPLLICFIGIDGSGKTTLAKVLANALFERGRKSKYIHNRFVPVLSKPFMVIGKLFFFRRKGKFENYLGYSATAKRVFKNSFIAVIYQYCLLLDYAFQTMMRLSLPLIFRRSVICDRYLYDTVTDISVDLNYSKARLKASLGAFSHLFPKPCLVFLVDIPEEIAYSRKTDIPALEFLKDRRTRYLDIAREYEMTILDGSQDASALKSIINTKLDEVIR